MRALLTGILGMDGFHMTELLHSKGYLVYGVIRKDTTPSRLVEIKSLVPSIILFRADITKKQELAEIIKKVQPDEMYNFAGVSDVLDPFKNVGLTMDVNSVAPRYMLECISSCSPHTKFFQASSRLVFGDYDGPMNEFSIQRPKIPYAAAKVEADLSVKFYRQQGIFACSGIFFNHESERRPERFFSRRVSVGVAKIYLGLSKEITVGNLEDMRDFGYAKDYMEAAWLMLQQDTPKDYVIGTGEVMSTGDYLNLAISMYNIQSCCRIEFVDQKRIKGADQWADIRNIKKDLGWCPKTAVPEIIKRMVDHDISLLQKQTA